MKTVEPMEVIMLITPLSKLRDDGEVHSARCSETFVQTLVRCKDCKYCEVFKNGVNCWCNEHGRVETVDWFCADGKPKGVIED